MYCYIMIMIIGVPKLFISKGHNITSYYCKNSTYVEYHIRYYEHYLKFDYRTAQLIKH